MGRDEHKETEVYPLGNIWKIFTLSKFHYPDPLSPILIYVHPNISEKLINSLTQ